MSAAKPTKSMYYFIDPWNGEIEARYGNGDGNEDKMKYGDICSINKAISKYAVKPNVQEFTINAAMGKYSMDFLKAWSPSIRKIQVPFIDGLNPNFIKQLTSICVFNMSTQVLNYLAIFPRLQHIECYCFENSSTKPDVKTFRFKTFKIHDQFDGDLNAMEKSYVFVANPYASEDRFVWTRK